MQSRGWSWGPRCSLEVQSALELAVVTSGVCSEVAESEVQSGLYSAVYFAVKSAV